MVGAAIAIRSALDDGGGHDPDGGDVVVLCAADLADASAALGPEVDVRLEVAADTARALVDRQVADDVDAWVTTSAWTEVVTARAADALGSVTPLATSPAVVAVAPGRLEAVEALCSGKDVWACLGDAAGTDWAQLGDGSHPEWRELKVGLTDPDSAIGLSLLASTAAGFFGSSTFAANDPAFAEFEGWLAQLAEPSATGDPDPARTLATRPGTYSAAGSVAAVAARFDTRGVGVVETDPAVEVSVVAVGLHGDDPPSLGAVAAALADTGWAPAGGPPPAPTLKPGVMAALHSLWRAVTS